MLTKEQIIEKRYGIGGSEAGAVLGVSRWKTPVELYLEKTGQAPPVKQTDVMWWGVLLEDVVAQAAAARMGVKVRRRRKILRHPLRPWMLANLDRDIVGIPAIMEIKTTAFMDEEWGPDGSDKIPPTYLAQVVHYMAVRNVDVAYVPVLFLASRKLHIYVVKRDRDVEAMLISAEAEFWYQHVLRGIPPRPITDQDYSLLYPVDDGQSRYASDEMLATVAELRAVRAEVNEAKARQAELEKSIKGYIGERSELLDNTGQKLVTWCKSKDSVSIDWEGVARRLYAEEGLDPIEDYAREQKLVVTKEGSRSFLLKKPKKQKGASAQPIGNSRTKA